MCKRKKEIKEKLPKVPCQHRSELQHERQLLCQEFRIWENDTIEKFHMQCHLEEKNNKRVKKIINHIRHFFC